MKQFRLLVSFFMLIPLECILFFSGCKPYEWGRENFKQAERYEEHMVKKMEPFIKSTQVYHQLGTYAHMDALLLTDQAREFYVDYYAKHHHFTPEKKSVLTSRLLQENKYYIAFYVLGSQAEHTYTDNYALHTGRYLKHGPMFGDKDAVWQMSMTVDGKEYTPDSIRVVDLPLEYQYFFGSHFSQFKNVYLVKFDTVDEKGNEVLSPGKHTVTLNFISGRYTAQLEWKDVEYTKESLVSNDSSDATGDK